MQPKYPKITVKLAGEDGNAFTIIGKVRVALMENNVPSAEILQFQSEAMSGDYNNLLATAAKWVNVE